MPWLLALLALLALSMLALALLTLLALTSPALALLAWLALASLALVPLSLVHQSIRLLVRLSVCPSIRSFPKQAVYMTASVPYGWAGAVMEVKSPFGCLLVALSMSYYVDWSVGQSAGWSIGPFVGPSVTLLKFSQNR